MSSTHRTSATASGSAGSSSAPRWPSSASSWPSAALGALLAVGAGIDLIVTGASGYCPLYARLGHMPRSLQGTAR